MFDRSKFNVTRDVSPDHLWMASISLDHGRRNSYRGTGSAAAPPTFGVLEPIQYAVC